MGVFFIFFFTGQSRHFHFHLSWHLAVETGSKVILVVSWFGFFVVYSEHSLHVSAPRSSALILRGRTSEAEQPETFPSGLASLSVEKFGCLLDQRRGFEDSRRPGRILIFQAVSGN